jgi:hypothetical protein
MGQLDSNVQSPTSTASPPGRGASFAWRARAARPRRSGTHVYPFESEALKPGYHISGSRVEINHELLSSAIIYGSAASSTAFFNFYSPIQLVHSAPPWPSGSARTPRACVGPRRWRRSSTRSAPRPPRRARAPLSRSSARYAPRTSPAHSPTICWNCYCLRCRCRCRAGACCRCRCCAWRRSSCCVC